jgi:hypothetical protein
VQDDANKSAAPRDDATGRLQRGENVRKPEKMHMFSRENSPKSRDFPHFFASALGRAGRPKRDTTGTRATDAARREPIRRDQ